MFDFKRSRLRDGGSVVNADTVTLGLGDGWMTREQSRLGRVRRYPAATQSATHMQHDIPNLLSYIISLQRRRSE